MGQSEKRKPGGQPRKIFTDSNFKSGNEIGEGFGQTLSDDIKFIEIYLTRINRKTHSNSAVGDHVTVQKEIDGLGVFVANEILGIVLSEDREIILKHRLMFGEILELEKSPISAKVILHN